MIPKVIHYCWFGNGEKPDLVKDCIASWRKYLPEYEIMEWNEGNFAIDSYQFSKEAYKERKFAFVADVCRLHALYTVGGVYLDTDVEFLKPFDQEMLDDCAFTGFEDNLLLSSATMGSEKQGAWVTDLLKYYKDRSFYLPNGSFDVNPNTEIITAFMKKEKGISVSNEFQKLAGYCTIYPNQFFSPKSWKTLKINATEKTYCIHHFAGSWVNDGEMSFIGKLFNAIFGKQFSDHLAGVYRKMLKK